ncbi:MAG: protein phosphatase CheZ [Burkholderiaceae bacterium]|nr:protein phosphatase CheZ [Burkholderiaceae bacterium]
MFDEVASATAPNIASPSLPPPPTDTATDSASKPIYDRIGTILRQLHNSMRELGYDRALQDVVSEVTNAKGRLEYVATLAEQSATRVLNSIDDSMPQQEQLAETAKTIEQKWDALFKGELGIEDFKQLAKDSQQFAANAGKMAEQEKARLLEIMMAQDFQDITGQIIKKVVTITQRLEQDMAQILRDNAPHDSADKPVDLLAGPDVPVNALAQDDVDGLLGSLGF